MTSNNSCTGTKSLRFCFCKNLNLGHRRCCNPPLAHLQLTHIFLRTGTVLESTSCPLLAQSRHGPLHCTCPLSGIKRTSAARPSLRPSMLIDQSEVQAEWVAAHAR